MVIQCPNCGNAIDNYERICPICEKENTKYVERKSLLRATVDGDKKEVESIERDMKDGKIVRII